MRVDLVVASLNVSLHHSQGSRAVLWNKASDWRKFGEPGSADLWGKADGPSRPHWQILSWNGESLQSLFHFIYTQIYSTKSTSARNCKRISLVV